MIKLVKMVLFCKFGSLNNPKKKKKKKKKKIDFNFLYILDRFIFNSKSCVTLKKGQEKAILHKIQ